MSLAASIRNILNTSTDLVALCGDRIRPDELDASDTLPAIIIELGSVNSIEDLSDAGGAEFEGEFSIVCCASTRTAATSLETLVRSTLDGYRGTVGGVTWRPITYATTSHDHESSEDGSESDDWFINEVEFTAWGQR